MFAGIGIGIVEFFAKSALMQSPIGGILKGIWSLLGKIPWQVYAVIFAVIALWLGVRWHAHEVHKTWQSGYNQAIADIKAQEAKKVAPLVTAKQVADAKIDVGNEGVKKNVQDQNHRVDVNIADLLSMYQTTGRARPDAGGSVHQADGSASAQPADARPDDGRAAPDSQGADPVITVPAKWLITRAGVCDRDYIALKAWEQSYAIYYQAYTEWLAKTKSATHSTSP